MEEEIREPQIKRFFKEENLVIKYTLIGQKLNQENSDLEFHKKVQDFFEGKY